MAGANIRQYRQSSNMVPKSVLGMLTAAVSGLVLLVITRAVYRDLLPSPIQGSRDLAWQQ